MNVLVINQCSTNKGDRAVLYFVLRQLQACGIERVTVSASHPEYWRDKPDFPDIAVRIIPWGWDVSRKKNATLLGKVFHLLWKVKLPRRIHFPLIRNALISDKRPWYLRFLVNGEFLRTVNEADLVISTGGHHLTTIIAGSVKTPQIFDMAVTLLCDKPLLLWSQSVGTFEFKAPANKEMTRKILSKAGQIFIRDEASEEQIQKLGVSHGHLSKTRESVFGLYDIVKSRVKPSDRQNILGISVWTGNKKSAAAWEYYVRSFAGFVDYAIETGGFKVRFFPMEMQGADRPCIEDIIRCLGKKENCEIVEDFPGTLEHINKIAQCKIFLGHKTHSQIFSLVAATPLIALAYHRKTEDFMAQFGLEDYCIVDTQLSLEKLIELFEKISENLDTVSHKQQQIALGMYKRVGEDFKRMIDDYLKRS
jgi:polysaccharide pyruvyl transferase WcaK-like protein